jgi:hypothetical protein
VTDPYLAHRAEQALLGALFTRPGTATALAEVTWRDFADSRHQAIFSSLADGGSLGRGPAGRARDWLTRLFSRQARDTAAYMGELPGLCPEPAHLGSYAVMVTEAREDREAARIRRAEHDSQRLASAAAWLDGNAPQRGSRRADRDGLPSGTARLARALRPPAQQAGSTPVPGPASSARGTRVAPGSPDGAAARPASRADVEPDAVAKLRSGDLAASRPQLSPEGLQDLVLADLIQRPADAHQVIAWLPAQVFTPGPRRELYQAVSEKISGKEPVDALIMAWDAARRHDHDPSGEPGEVAGGRAQPELALRIGSLDPAPGTAAILGKILLADRLLATRFGDSWYEKPQIVRLIAAPAKPRNGNAPAPRAAPEPAPAAARGAAPARSPADGPERVRPSGPARDTARVIPPAPRPGADGPVPHM